ncbi:MAG: hypothetical protein HY579_08540 [Nitrospinae bacterium]|nr:hypothetical protein [Nitrospinota bacterium]
MFFFKLLTVHLLIYSILFLAGWGICKIVCKGKYEPYAFPLSFIIGTFPLGALPEYFSLLGVKTQIGGWLSFIALAAFSLFHLIKEPHVLINSVKRQSPVLLFLVVLANVPVFAVLLKTGFITSTMQSFNFYVSAGADYLVQHPFYEKWELDYDRPITNYLAEVKGNNTLFGGYYFISAVSVLFGVPTFKILFVLTGCLFSLLPISVHIACKEGFGLKDKTALLVALLATINFTYCEWVMVGQIGFVAGLAGLIAALGFLPDMLEGRNKPADLVFFSFLCAAIMGLYFPLIAYPLGIGIVFIALGAASSFDKVLPSLRNMGWIILGAAVLTGPFLFVFATQHGASYASNIAHNTNNVPRDLYLEEVLGLAQHFSLSPLFAETSRINFLKRSIAIILALLFFGAGLRAAIKKKDRLFLSSAVLCSVLAVYFARVDYFYHFYKHASVCLFVILAGMALGGEWLYRPDSKLIRTGLLGVSIIFIGLNLDTVFQYIFKTRQPVISASLIELGGVKQAIPPGKRILVNSFDPPEEAWMTYFLGDRRVKLRGSIEPWGFWIFSPFTGKPNPRFFYDPGKDAIDFTLSRKTDVNKDIVPFDSGGPVFQNEEFIVTKDSPLWVLGRGWNPIEEDAAGVFRWTQQESLLFYNRPLEDSAIRVRGTVPDVYKTPLQISVYVNQALADEFIAGPGVMEKVFVPKGVEFKKTGNAILIRLDQSFSPSALLHTADLRTLGIQIKKIEIIPADQRPQSGGTDSGLTQTGR